MNPLPAVLKWLDSFQRSHSLPGFLYAVVKKYGDDEAGYQAALLTYYGFLSLFPLLLVLTTVTDIIARHHAGVRETILNSAASYFPVLGNQLASHVGALHKSGFALIIGLLFTMYGARGVADAFKHGVSNIWRIPRIEREGFPKSQLKSLLLIAVGGLGLLLAAVAAGFTAGFGHGGLYRVISLALNLAILFGLFNLILNLTLPQHLKLKETWPAALTAAMGLLLLQAAGTYLLARELKNLDALYSNFALALGLLFWIYLQAQMLYYALEIASVRTLKLWPRALVTDNLTDADKQAYTGQAHKEKSVPPQHIKSRFR